MSGWGQECQPSPGAPTIWAVCLRLPLLSLEGTQSQGVSPRSQAPLLEGCLGEANGAEEAAAGPLCPAPPSGWLLLGPPALCHGPQEHPTGSDLCFLPGSTMSGPRTPEPALDGQGASPTGSQDEDMADGTQHSHRMLSFSDALLSIIATVMVRAGPHPARALTRGPEAAGGGEEQPRTGLSPRHVASREQSVPSPRGVPGFVLCLFS